MIINPLMLNELLVILSLVSSIIIYFFLPALIPTHWGVSGEIDAWGPNWVSLMIPLITLGCYYLWKLIPAIAVFKKNIKGLGKWFNNFLTVLILFFLAIYFTTVINAFGYIFNIKFMIIPSLTLLFFYIASMLTKVKRNYFIGVKTPWTLSSDKSWKKTHEKAAIGFRIYAILFLTLFFLPPEFFLWVVLIPIIVLIAYLYTYSYLEWKKDKKATKK